MNLLSNMERIEYDIFCCLKDNNQNIKQENVHVSIDADMNYIVIANTSDSPSLSFNMKLNDSFIVCVENKDLKLEVEPYKSSPNFIPRTQEEKDEKLKQYELDEAFQKLAESFFE